MDNAQLIESVKTELGYPIVDLFISDTQIETMIAKSIRKCQGKACPTKVIKLPISDGKIDVSTYNMEAVKTIYMDVDNSGNFDLFNPSTYNVPSSYDMMNRSVDYAVRAGNNNELRRLEISDFYLDGDYVYVDNYTGNVTLEYIPKDIVLEDLDTQWTGWVEGYVTALAKIVEGRIRSKYKLNNSPIEIESDNLISEGTSEKQDLDSKLDEAMGFFTIMR